MSDKLNEKFEELVTEQKVIVEAGDPMPTVSANVIPGTGSEPSREGSLPVPGITFADTVGIGSPASTITFCSVTSSSNFSFSLSDI